MSYKGFIYKYTSPSGKIYIGQTTKDPKKRAGYKGRGYSGTVFGNAIKKYGFENFKLEILHIVEDDSVENLINKLNKLEENEILKNKANKDSTEQRRKLSKDDFRKNKRSNV